MGKVYRDKAAIPIPNGLYPKKTDGRITILQDVNGKQKEIIIGYAATSYTMYVNDTFRDIYPDEWKKYYGDRELCPDRLYVGLYALTLGIIHKIGLYPLLLQSFEPGITNAILDYAMYFIVARSDVTMLYNERMREEILFSNTVYSDSWYSDFFKNKMSSALIHEFRVKWLMKCKADGITKAWISIDGSNNDCEVVESSLSEYGYAKSHNDCRIVSFIYAVNATDGRPITYFVNPGSVIDSKAFMEIASMLKDASIEVEGVILDSGFCVYDVLQTIIGCGYKYVIMTPCDTHGHTSLMKSKGDSIKWNIDYAVSDEHAIFGIAERSVLFKTHPDLEAYINLYYDGLRGAHQSEDFLLKLRNELKEVQTKLNAGKAARIKPQFSDYLSITEDGSKLVCRPNADNCNEKMGLKGFFSIASSDNFGAEETLMIYHLRDTSETGYCIIKSQQGFYSTRVHSTNGIESKFAVCFIGNIIRHEILLACKKIGYNTNEMIQKLNRIYLRRGIENSYYSVHKFTKPQTDLLACFGIQADDFKSLAVEVNKRRNTVFSNNVYPLPAKHPVVVQKPGRGRKKGSKNKKTLEREAAREAMLLSGLNPSALDTKKPRGRPKGKKDAKPRIRRTKEELKMARPAEL